MYFQIKKCTEPACWYCTLNPPRLPPEVFQDLHFIPDPVRSIGDPTKYASLQEVYGKQTDDSERPSVTENPQKTHTRDTLHKTLLQGAKIRDFVKCVECQKPRCVYSASKLNFTDQLAFRKVKEGDIGLQYTCGSCLFPQDSKYYDTLVVRESLTCTSSMETGYYASKMSAFKPVCFHCGIGDDLADDDNLKNLKRTYSVVRPICRGYLFFS